MINMWRLRIGIVLALLLVSVGYAQRFEWRDVEQNVEILPDGEVIVEDERTLWTTGDFGEAFICLELDPGQDVTLLEGSGAVSPGPDATALTQPCEDGPGTELVVRQDSRVSERRVRFHYQLSGSVDFYSDVVQWYWIILEQEHPPIHGYELTVTAPGAMSEPYDAFVHRFANPEEPEVELSQDRSRLSVRFDQIPDGDGVEIRYLMDPALFDVQGDEPGLEQLLEDEAEIAGIQEGMRRRQALLSSRLWWLAPVLLVLWLAFGIYRANKRYGQDPDVGPVMKYPFEPPSEQPPGAVSLMLSKVSSTPQNGFHATIMELARRGYGTFDSENGKFNMKLELDKDDSELTPFEKSVLDYLKEAAQTGKREGLFGPRQVEPDYLYFSELKSYSQRKMSTFMRKWGRELNKWVENRMGGPLVDPRSRKVANAWAGVALLVLALNIGGIWLTEGEAMIGFIVGAVLSGVLLIVASTVIPAWRREVAPEVYGWQGFRRTLSDYTRMKDAPDDFFMLWDQYYCYAAAMGVAAKFLRNLQRAAPLRGIDDRTMMRRASWMGAGVASASDFSSFSRSIQSLSSALNSASASASSGGSSSGGGGGGGGGSSGGR